MLRLIILTIIAYYDSVARASVTVRAHKARFALLFVDSRYAKILKITFITL